MSAPSASALPANRAEVAIVGRSNVGKSSLLNALAARKALAHVSKTPGRTRHLNCYEVAPGAALIDCPGYGYAVAAHRERIGWQAMMERYLLERQQLEMIMVLVDGEIGPAKLDLQLLDWVRANELPHSLVATKADKVKSSRRATRRAELARQCQLEPDDVVWTSAEKGMGIDELRARVRLWLGLA